MADTDTQVPETVAPQPLENTNSVPQPAPVQGNADVDAVRKEAEQAKMRANQLENQLAEAQKKIAEAEQAKLQEKEDYKTLWEQANSQLQEVVTTQEQAAFQAEVAKKESEVTSQYSEEVLEVAKAAGLKLSGIDDETTASFKAALDKITEKVGASASNRPENHSGAVVADTARREQALERARQGDRSAVQEAVDTLGFIQAYDKAMKQQ